MIPGISGFRRTRGTPIPLWANVRILTYGEGADAGTSFTDYSSNAWTITANGNAQVDTGIPIYGPSIQFDGTGDFLSIADHASLQVGTSNDFCVEAYVRVDVLGKIHCVIGKRDSVGAEEFAFDIDASGNIQLATYGSGAAKMDCSTTTAPIAANTIYHVAGSRQGTTGRVFVNGYLIATATQSGTVTTNTDPVRIGRNGFDTARDFQGRMSWVRMVIGEALYTEDFEPPYPPLPTS